MKRTLEKKLMAKYPRMLRCGLIEAPDGWYKLVGMLCAQLSVVCPNLKAYHIKSKFGGLRFYVEEPTSNLSAKKLISEAEMKSFGVCEFCGKPGKTIKIRHWIYTVCPPHQQVLESEK
jgi:hypothetical protein